MGFGESGILGHWDFGNVGFRESWLLGKWELGMWNFMKMGIEKVGSWKSGLGEIGILGKLDLGKLGFGENEFEVSSILEKCENGNLGFWVEF